MSTTSHPLKTVSAFVSLQNRLKRKPDWKGSDILELWRAHGMPSRGCAIEPGKTYHITYMQDEITFHELTEAADDTGERDKS